MANITVTYTFSNSTTADASQVNTNFTDLINGTSDGTKDFSISALTCAGTATFNGNVTLGNATSDDITWTGSLASSIPVKTTASYNIGTSSLGILSIYFGRNSQTVRVVPSASMAATYTLTLPVNVGSSGQALVDSDAAGTLAFRTLDGPGTLQNLSITASVATSALTVALKDAAGSDPSSTSPVRIAFRNSTATTGSVTVRSVTSATSVVVSSGSTLGTTSAVASYIYVYAIDNSGTVELAVSSKLFQDGELVSTTAEGGAGAADSATVMYSTTARSNVPCRLIGRMSSTQATAGTWATAPTPVISGGSDVGFGEVQQSSSGLVKSAGQLLGTNTNDSAATGYVGEYVSTANSSAQNFPTTAQWGDAGSISLTAGDWDITVQFELRLGTASGLGAEIEYGVSSTSGNSATGLTRGTNHFSTFSPTASANSCVTIAAFRASVSSTTTYYGKLRASYSSGTPQWVGIISARRVR